MIAVCKAQEDPLCGLDYQDAQIDKSPIMLAFSWPGIPFLSFTCPYGPAQLVEIDVRSVAYPDFEVDHGLIAVKIIVRYLCLKASLNLSLSAG